MTSDDQPKRKPGRPPGTTRSTLTESLPRIRVTPEQLAKVRANGHAWLRALIDKAK